MAVPPRGHVFTILLLAIICHVAVSQTTTTATSDDKNNRNGDKNNNGSTESNSSKKSTNSSTWITSSSNCSCVLEVTALKRDLREEINQRLALKAALDSYVAELAEVRSLASGNSSKMVVPLNVPAAMTPAVAFSAKLSYNRELKPLDTVIFDTVLTNDGNAYDLDSGKFTAIVTGTYLFHSTILSGYNTKVETAIIVNDKEIARIYSGAHDAHGSGSNMAIVNLRNGDSVWVRLLYQGGNHVHGYYSTFSGALLRASEP